MPEDSIHPNDAGNALMAEVFSDVVNRVLDQAEPLRDVIAEFEHFWAWFDDTWNLCKRRDMGFFETMDMQFDYLDYRDVPAIGIEVPERL
jgi:hypothetical protein